MLLPTDLTSLLLFALSVALVGLKAWALVDAATRSAGAYPAAGKLTKPAWVAILSVGLLLAVLSVGGPLSIFGIFGTVAAIVYLVDVRPAVTEVGRGGRWN